jgi:hypothetical protein
MNIRKTILENIACIFSSYSLVVNIFTLLCKRILLGIVIGGVFGGRGFIRRERNHRFRRMKRNHG